MRKKTAILLLIFLGSLLPFTPARADVGPLHSIEDALALMYISDAILLDEDFPEEAFRNPGLLSSTNVDPVPQTDNAVLAGMLNAAKSLRNDLDANCGLLSDLLRQQGKDCDADLVQKYCSEQKTRINAIIGFLHDQRGDRRRPLTKVWHFLKRSGRGFWHRIGPVGRTFLRQVGPETLQLVASGGLSGGALRSLIKHTARSIGREHLKQVVFQGVQRLLHGQVAILQAAGVDICEEGTQDEGSTTEQESSACSTDGRWLDEFWKDAVLPRLIVDGKNCQPAAIGSYRNCLQDQAADGICPEPASEACFPLYEAIPANDSGGSVALSPAILHGAAESVSTSLSYPSGGGAVTGQFYFVINDNVNYCTSTTTSTINSAAYDQKTCSMNGMADITRVFEGIACPSVCGPSTGACPKTFQGIVPFEATLEDGVLSGGIGDQECLLGCFGFSAGP